MAANDPGWRSMMPNHLRWLPFCRVKTYRWDASIVFFSFLPLIAQSDLVWDGKHAMCLMMVSKVIVDPKWWNWIPDGRYEASMAICPTRGVSNRAIFFGLFVVCHDASEGLLAVSCRRMASCTQRSIAVFAPLLFFTSFFLLNLALLVLGSRLFLDFRHLCD
ncbi:hypothetical protein BC940DRAFT_294173, partial [Gongronella butleri]